MDKNKKQQIITAVLLVIMCLSFARTLLFKKKPVQGPGTGASGQAAIVANLSFLTMVRQSENFRNLQEAQWAEDWGRDPFVHSSLDVTQGSAHFVLSGIVWDEKMPVAIVNQKLLKTGDKIDGCQVLEIERNSVKVVCGDAPYELKLFQAQTDAKEAAAS